MWNGHLVGEIAALGVSIVSNPSAPTPRKDDMPPSSTIGSSDGDASASRVVLVTGAGRRVGAAIAIAFAQPGTTVILHHHSATSGVEEVGREVTRRGGEGVPMRADLTDAASCRALITRVVEEHGGIDVLVSSAANFERIPFDEVDEAALERALTLNVRASFSLAHAAAQTLRDREGNIVLITCTSATLPYANFLPYVVSKGAAKQLMRALAIELAPHVRVNAVAPGTVLPPEEMSVEQREKLAHKTLLRRIGSAEDVAEAVVYLANARFVTGQEILVDGGVVLAGRDSGEG